MPIYQMTVKAKISGETEFRNIHHYESDSVLSEAELQDAADTLDQEYKDNLRTRISDSVLFYAYDIRRVDIGDLPTNEFVATAGTWLGTETTLELLPTQNAAVVTFKANTSFPRTTRTYLFGFTELANGVGGVIGAPAVILIDAWADDMEELVITGPVTLTKVAVQYTGTPRAVTSSNTVLASPATDIWATQRRRRKGVGI